MLARLRSLAFLIFLILFVTVMGLVCLPFALFGKNISRAIVKRWSKLALIALGLITGVRYRVEGAEHIPSGGALIAANHQSMWETIALYAIMPKPVMVYKKELLKIPIYGWWASFAGNIAVDRKDGAKALRVLTRDTKTHIDAGEQVIIFPEGTRISPGETARFQSGIAGLYTTSGAPCTPVAHDSGRFWRHPGGLKTPGVITIRFLPAIAPGLDRKTFLADLKSRIDGARPDLQTTANISKQSND